MNSEARAEFNLPGGSWSVMDGSYSLGADYDKHDKSGLSIRPLMARKPRGTSKVACITRCDIALLKERICFIQIVVP